MPRNNCQKIKMLILYEILQEETDEDHPITTSAIVEKLRSFGITCDRRTVGTDMDTLIEFGYDIGMKMAGHEKGYYTTTKAFSKEELKILMDVVQAAGFISQSQTQELVDKISWLSGKKREELLRENVVLFKTAKHDSRKAFQNVAVLEQAIIEKRKVSFLYFERDEQGKIADRKKTLYVVDPLVLVFQDDRYYLLSYVSDDITRFRVDRMASVAVEEEPASEKALMEDSEDASYAERVLIMYGGPIRDVTICFPKSLISVIQDKFGEDTIIVSIGDDQCVASIQVQINPAFWGWLFQYAGEITVVTPEDVSKEYVDRAITVMKR